MTATSLGLYSGAAQAARGYLNGDTNCVTASLDCYPASVQYKLRSSLTQLDHARGTQSEKVDNELEAWLEIAAGIIDSGANY